MEKQKNIEYNKLTDIKQFIGLRFGSAECLKKALIAFHGGCDFSDFSCGGGTWEYGITVYIDHKGEGVSYSALVKMNEDRNIEASYELGCVFFEIKNIVKN